jgi:hypothetical protein
MVISTDYKWARNKHLSAARLEDIVWSEMHCVWHWATQAPCGIFHSLVTLLAQVRAPQRCNSGESEREGLFRVGDRSRARFATPADFPRHGCSPYSQVHVRRERSGLSIVRGPFSVVPCQTLIVTSHNFSIHLSTRPTSEARRDAVRASASKLPITAGRAC